MVVQTFNQQSTPEYADQHKACDMLVYNILNIAFICQLNGRQGLTWKKLFVLLLRELAL